MAENLLDLNDSNILDSEVVSGFTGGVLSDDFRGGDYSDVTGEKDSELYNKYKESGSKKTFKEWLNQDSTKNLISSLATLGSAFLAGKNLDNEIKNEKIKEEENKIVSSKKEIKIIGMKPIWFTVTVSVLALSIIGGIVFYKLKK